jgi:hypothetical protein
LIQPAEPHLARLQQREHVRDGSTRRRSRRRRGRRGQLRRRRRRRRRRRQLRRRRRRRRRRRQLRRRRRLRASIAVLAAAFTLRGGGGGGGGGGSRNVAVQVEFGKTQTLKPGNHSIGSGVGSSGAFKRCGSTGFANLYSPHREAVPEPRRLLLHEHGAGELGADEAAHGGAHGSGLPHKHEHRLDGDEISPTSLVHTYRADQWASCEATHTNLPTAASSGTRRSSVWPLPYPLLT